MQWYYVLGGRQHGPVSEDELIRLAQQGVLRPDDYVWNETMGSEWARVRTVPSLCAASTGAEPADGSGTSRSEEPPEAEFVPAAGGSGTRPPSERITCTGSVGPAWQFTRRALFNPLDLAKWFTLGFSAWLATLGEGGGAGWSGGDLSRIKSRMGTERADIESVRKAVEEFLRDDWQVIAVKVPVALAIMLAVSLVVSWVRCRGKFMFLDNVVHNRERISEPWREWAPQANSLFWWRIGYRLVCLGVSLLLLAVTFISAIVPLLKGSAFRPALPGIAVSGTLWLIFAVVAGYIGRFLEDFVVPIMYRDRIGALAAWGRFLDLFRRHTGDLLLYGLFYVLLASAAGVCVLLAALATCCIAACLMLIPYIGAVLLLPVTVFFRAYSLYYLSQFGEEYVLHVGAER
jgi:hypothetical protein